MGNIDYGKILKRSWNLTWKNKWLWVMGMVLAVFSGGSGGGGGGGSSSGGSLTPSSSPSPSSSGKELSLNVLGEATNVLTDWFSSIPVGTWIALGIIVFVFIVFATAVSWVLTSWAEGALIFGLDEADRDREVNLKSVSPYGLSKIKNLIIYKLIWTGILIGIVLLAASVFLIGFLIKAFVPILGIIWIALFGFVAVLGLMVALVLFAMLDVYAKRLIVLKNHSAWTAWKTGFSLGKGNFIPTVLMGIINSMIGCTAGCLGFFILLVIFAAPGWILIYPIFRGGVLNMPTIPQIIGIIVLVVLFFSLNILVRAVFVVFNQGNWNLFFKQITEGKNE